MIWQIMRRTAIYILIGTLNLFDYAQTVYWTGLYGIETEINPIMRGALSEPWVFAVVKLILFPALLLYMWHKKHDDSAWMALGMFIVTVIMNFRIILGW